MMVVEGKAAEEVNALRRARDVLWAGLQKTKGRENIPSSEVMDILLDGVNALTDLEKEVIR